MAKSFKNKLLFNVYKMEVEYKLAGCDVSHSYESKVARLSDLYEMMRNLSDQIKGDQLYDDIYLNLRNRLVGKERYVFSNEFICESKPDFDPQDPKYLGGARKEMSIEEFLDLLVWLIRKSLLADWQEEDESIENLDDVSLTDQCFKATYMGKSLCDGLKTYSKAIKIEPGFTDREKLFDGHGYHFFLMVELPSGEYIVDCTYRQFFRLDRNLHDRLGVYGLSGCNPGYYMMLDPERKRVAETILKRGWIKATPNNFKAYMDGFALSFRNALYYERNGETEFKVPYTFYDYKRFLMGEDDQLRKQEFECLAVQESVLKDKDYCKKLK